VNLREINGCRRPDCSAIRLLLNGAEDLTVRIRDGKPRTALLEVGIANSQRDDLTSPVVSILIPLTATGSSWSSVGRPSRPDVSGWTLH